MEISQTLSVRVTWKREWDSAEGTEHYQGLWKESATSYGRVYHLLHQSNYRQKLPVDGQPPKSP